MIHQNLANPNWNKGPTSQSKLEQNDRRPAHQNSKTGKPLACCDSPTLLCCTLLTIKISVKTETVTTHSTARARLLFFGLS
jgi:hypothetical protein